MTNSISIYFIGNQNFTIIPTEDTDTPEEELEKLKAIQSKKVKFLCERKSTCHNMTEVLQYLQGRCTLLTDKVEEKDRLFLQEFSQALSHGEKELSVRQMSFQGSNETLLPPELIPFILSHLDIKNLLMAERINTIFKQLVHHRLPRLPLFSDWGTIDQIKHRLALLIYTLGRAAHSNTLSSGIFKHLIQERNSITRYRCSKIESLLSEIPSLTTRDLFYLSAPRNGNPPDRGFCDYMNRLLREKKIALPPDPTMEPNIQAALLEACEAAHLERMELLIRLGANPNPPDTNSHGRPLVKATRSGSSQAVELLLNLSPTTFPEEVLKAAFASAVPPENILRTNVEIFNVLLQYIASKHLSRNCLVPTASRTLPYLSKTLTVFKPLFDAGDISLSTVFSDPYSDWNIEVVRFVLDRGAPVNAVDRGLTPLHCAAFSDHTPIIQLLLERGADPTLRDGRGRTALDIARSQGNPAIIALLEATQKKKEQPSVEVLQARIAQLEEENKKLREKKS